MYKRFQNKVFYGNGKICAEVYQNVAVLFAHYREKG